MFPPHAQAAGRAPRSLAALLIVSAAIVALLPASARAGEATAIVAGHDMPSWAPDGDRLVFVGFRSGRVGDIFSVRPDGKGLRRLTATAQHEDMPRYSPDGSKIAFVRKSGPGGLDFHIFAMNADGTDQTQITHTGAPNFAPPGRRTEAGSPSSA